MLQICMGLDNNVATEIKDIDNGDVYRQETINILSATTYRRYWIEWTNTKVSVCGAVEVNFGNCCVALTDVFYTLVQRIPHKNTCCIKSVDERLGVTLRIPPGLKVSYFRAKLRRGTPRTGSAVIWAWLCLVVARRCSVLCASGTRFRKGNDDDIFVCSCT